MVYGMWHAHSSVWNKVVLKVSPLVCLDCFGTAFPVKRAQLARDVSALGLPPSLSLPPVASDAGAISSSDSPMGPRPFWAVFQSVPLPARPGTGHCL